jgi:O-acetylhomoserine (thiol)-lyase
MSFLSQVEQPVMSDKPSFKHFTTLVLHEDRLGAPEHGVLHKAIHPSVAFGYEDSRELAAVFQGRKSGFAYGRQSNPTVEALATKITHMEEGLGSICFSTGMAALGAMFLALLRSGDHLISSAFLFGNTNSLLSTLQNFGIQVSLVDSTDSASVEAVIQDNTRMVFVETISNPVTQVSDLEGIGKICRDRNILFCVDNTMTSPWLIKPKKYGAGLVMNALTKYVGGHGNALGGCLTATGTYDWTDYPNLYENYKTGNPLLWGLTQIKKKGLRDFGAAMAPDSAHYLSVGSDTLALRMDRACANAQQLSEFFDEHPRVAKVFYPGLMGHPQYERAKSLFSLPGAIMSIELVEGADCFEFLNQLELVICSSNLGDTRTLGIPVAHTIYYEMGPERRASMGVADSMVRLSIGIEDVSDLINDFSKALLAC